MDYVLVTGGAGFIGSHLVRSLVTRGVKVRVLDDFSSGAKRNLPDEVLGDTFTGSVADIDACRQAVQSVDTVFHLAAQVSVPASVDDPAGSDRVNSGGTLNILLAARDAGVKRVVFSSSAAVYGDIGGTRAVETLAPRPGSPYGIQKLTGEHYARCFWEAYGLQTVSLRYFNVYGPRQNPNAAYAAAVPKFLTLILSGKPPVVFGDGEQTRDFCSVHDVVRANLKAATTDRPEALGEVFNIACGQPISVNLLLTQIAELTGQAIEPIYAAERRGDIKHSSANIDKARSALGFDPGISLSRGLGEVLEHYSG